MSGKALQDASLKELMDQLRAKLASELAAKRKALESEITEANSILKEAQERIEDNGRALIGLAASVITSTEINPGWFLNGDLGMGVDDVCVVVDLDPPRDEKDTQPFARFRIDVRVDLTPELTTIIQQYRSAQDRKRAADAKIHEIMASEADEARACLALGIGRVPSQVSGWPKPVKSNIRGLSPRTVEAANRALAEALGNGDDEMSFEDIERLSKAANDVVGGWPTKTIDISDTSQSVLGGAQEPPSDPKTAPEYHGKGEEK